MKIREGFTLRSVAGENIVVPLGAAAKELNGVIRLNGTGKMLWEKLRQGSDRAGLVKVLTDAFGISEAQAGADVDAFLTSLQPAGCLEE